MSVNKKYNDERAKYAYDFAFRISEEKNEKLQKEFRSLARSFPVMIQNNGLCASIAFLQAKCKLHHEKLYLSIEGWLIKQNFIDKNKCLMDGIVELSRDDYRIVSKEIMAYLLWVKRFAEGLLKDE
ncbi:MAG: type III-B CRISPR module-associated protein Cmr5 [Defluviitaleaceae bacterium]|nr:type III-B CRISPR module-associated protein Cmr5 [Defluviitaleaceae bacterium]